MSAHGVYPPTMQSLIPLNASAHVHVSSCLLCLSVYNLLCIPSFEHARPDVSVVPDRN